MSRDELPSIRGRPVATEHENKSNLDSRIEREQGDSMTSANEYIKYFWRLRANDLRYETVAMATPLSSFTIYIHRALGNPSANRRCTKGEAFDSCSLTYNIPSCFKTQVSRLFVSY